MNQESHLLLRDYQISAIEKLESSEKRGSILQAPCGSGKTVMAAELIRRAVEDAKQVLFIAHRRELVRQCSDKLHRFGVDHGIIMAGFQKRLAPDVQVASIQTLGRRLKSKRLDPPRADLIIFDECHHAASASYMAVLEKYPNARVVGLTATPIRSDGVGLGGSNLFQDIISTPSIVELIELGHLVPIEYYAPSKPDLKGLRILAGDYSPGQLEKRMDKVQLIGDIVENFSRICPDRQAVVFSTGVGHSKHIRDQFLEAGILTEHLDAKTPKKERDDILERLKTGETQIVTNCMVLTEGWDCPPVSCCILARPTKSLGLYLQMAGRILRPTEGKTNAILIDHAGAIDRHGFVHRQRDWSLDPHTPIESRSQGAKQPVPITCEQCKAVYESEPKCPKCGFMPIEKAREFNVLKGDLGHLDPTGEWTGKKDTPYQRERFYHELRYYGDERGFKPGWAAYNFKEKYGCWPQKYKPNPVRPGAETRRWIKKKKEEYWKNKTREFRAPQAVGAEA